MLAALRYRLQITANNFKFSPHTALYNNTTRRGRLISATAVVTNGKSPPPMGSKGIWAVPEALASL